MQRPPMMLLSLMVGACQMACKANGNERRTKFHFGLAPEHNTLLLLSLAERRVTWEICDLQAQRDFFGSHTYERIDKPGSFHTVWDPRNSADSITTSSYNA